MRTLLKVVIETAAGRQHAACLNVLIRCVRSTVRAPSLQCQANLLLKRMPSPSRASPLERILVGGESMWLGRSMSDPLSERRTLVGRYVTFLNLLGTCSPFSGALCSGWQSAVLSC